MSRKAKKRVHSMPKLSFLDKLIYWVILLLICVSYFVLAFLPSIIGDKSAFADEMVIAKVGHISILWAIVPVIVYGVMTLVLWLKPYQDRRPIFGSKKIKYGPPAWPRIYPLFMKNKPSVWVSERKKKQRKQNALLLVTVLLISFIPYPWSFYGRDCLLADGGIKQYNMFNVCVQEFTSGQIDSVEFHAYRHNEGGKHTVRIAWDVKVTLTTDSGKEYTFLEYEFRRDKQGSASNWLPWMLQLKRRYDPSIVTYTGVDNLDEVIQDNKLTEPQIEMLYQLFDIS